MDWALLIAVALVWGSSFLWISIGLESFEPVSVGFLRLVIGAIAIWLLPSSRRRVGRDAWPAIFVIGTAGTAVAAVLFPFAQQRVESSVAGMIVAASPLATLVISVIMLRRSPGKRQIAGLLVGFTGVGLMAAPNLSGADAQPMGIAMLGAGVIGYGLANNFIVPVQQKYGSGPIIARALTVGALCVAPFGAPELANVSPSVASLGAILFLGVLTTGYARTLHSTLIGRTGATRGSLATYLIPVVAIILGVAFRDESVGPIELAGTAVVLVGAYLVSRGKESAS